MEVKMNKEIRDYQESMFWGLSFRQCLFSVLAILAALGIYFVTRKYAGEQVTGWLCVLGAAPFAACGFFRYHGMTAEQDLTGEQKEYATIAGERISAVKLLLDQLFEFARIEADELKLNCRNTDIHSVLRDVVASYYGDFEQKKCVPYIVIPNPPAIIWGDPDALTRIFSNVVYNALVHGEGNYQITAAIEEAQTVITIKNASSSIQQEDIPHLFDRFYTTDQSRTKKTTGLGLAIAQRLVTRMGGQIVASLQNGLFAIQVVFPIVNS